MTNKQALSEARRRWGKNAMIELKKHGLLKPEREAATAELRALREREPKERGTPEHVEWKKQKNQLQGRALVYRCTVGRLMDLAGMFTVFSVAGQGDTWEEAFASAPKRFI